MGNIGPYGKLGITPKDNEMFYIVAKENVLIRFDNKTYHSYMQAYSVMCENSHVKDLTIVSVAEYNEAWNKRF